MVLMRSDLTSILKACPFCGQSPVIHKGKRGGRCVECINEKCAVLPQTDWYADEDDAINAWNRRPNTVKEE